MGTVAGNGYDREMARSRLLSSVGLTVLLLAGCGGGDDGGPAPVDHPLVTDQDSSAAPNTVLVVGPYQLPASTIVSWTITDLPTAGPNSMDVALATTASVENGGELVTFGIQLGVSSTTGMTSPLPFPDSYTFVVVCRNPVDDCTFLLTLTANY
jgi:hypothetical protein